MRIGTARGNSTRGCDAGGIGRGPFRGRTIVLLIVVVLIGVKTYHPGCTPGRSWNRHRLLVRAAAVNQDGPIEMPPLPEVGPGRAIEPGVVFQEIPLPGGDCRGSRASSGFISRRAITPDHSLPCVLITAAGSNLVKGMDLSDGSRGEQLPYVRAGFAVVAYELDGAAAASAPASAAEMSQAMARFLAARSGTGQCARHALDFSALQGASGSTPGGSTSRDIARRPQ